MHSGEILSTVTNCNNQQRTTFPNSRFLTSPKGAMATPSDLRGLNRSIGAISGSSITLPKKLHTRTLLPATVYHNQVTDLWIATINMNQKTTGSNFTPATRTKNLKAFSFLTEREARESAYANAPPMKLPFECNPTCFICDTKFTMFKRASHCRNCGVCVCSSCSITWNKLMIPDTYHTKKGVRNIKVCNSCNYLSSAFRHALLQGNFVDMLAIYNSGNINLRCPFLNMKGNNEAMLPIHCAAQGGSLKILKWLVDVHYCPIRMIRTGNKNKTNIDDQITTSKGRTVLEIAMSGQRSDIVRYLVNEKNLSIYGIKDVQTSLAALDGILKTFPEKIPQSHYDITSPSIDFSKIQNLNHSHSFLHQCNQIKSISKKKKSNILSNEMMPKFEVSGPYDDDESSDEDDNLGYEMLSDDEVSVSTTVNDVCIICYENSIDCVITPCGHQVCCLKCSEKMSKCPICHIDCQILRIFKP